MEQMPRKSRGKGGEEGPDCDGRTALREIWKEWEENGEDRRSLRLVLENAVRRGKKRRMKI